MRPDDDDDDRPRRQRPRDDDAPRRPTAKKGGNGLMIVLLAVGGVLLLGCAACGGVGYWLFSKGKDALQEVANARVTTENAEKLREGMTKAEVETVLGPGKPATRGDFTLLESNATLTLRRIAEDHEKYWHPWADKGLVHVWRNGPHYILVAYNDPPDSGGKLKGLDYFTLKDGDNVHNERIKLPRLLSADPDAVRHGMAPKQGTTQTKGNPPPEPTNTRITAVELVTNPSQYLNKAVTVTGPIKDIDPTADGGFVRLDTGPEKTVRLALNADELRRAMAGGHGGNVVVEGTVSSVSGPFIDVVKCHVVQASAVGPGTVAGSMAREFQSNAEKADAKYKGKMVRVTGRLVAFEMGGVTPTVVIHGVDMLKGKAGSKPVRLVVAYPAAWKDEYARKKVGDTITVSGEYSSYADGTITINNGWLIP